MTLIIKLNVLKSILRMLKIYIATIMGNSIWTTRYKALEGKCGTMDLFMKDITQRIS